MKAILQMQNVSLTYHTPKNETLAVQDLSFECYDGELLGIVGPSGCGKTTILSLMAGILTPTRGEALIGGQKANSQSGMTGYMLQKDELMPWRTILSNVTLGLEIKKQKTPEKVEYAKELLQKYNLYDFKDFYPNQLSGGMKQRVALIRTLVLEPKLMLLDEPFSALDFQTRLNVVEDVYSILKSENKSAVFVTHDINEAISLCDRVIVLTQRPSRIKEIIDISPLNELSPLKRRENANFSSYFDKIWSNLQITTEKSNETHITQK
ncbi:MAG: ABC transporter ATP-binding protein [Clostridia bacterium]|nr:ABC transporter ATP-binding protein [Clostridia bacterium]MDE7348491.1 ABC transporter ATP-binding protein [Clostridia bacterium]